MGILNVTPDSFSDGGNWLDPDHALAHALRMEQEGADIIDIGGESTRPGSHPVPPLEQIRRVIPVIRKIRNRSVIPLSIDTTLAEVARAALAAGADIINDVSGCAADPALIPLAAETGAGLVAMHSQGSPLDMQVNPAYADVAQEVYDHLKVRCERLEQAGIPPERVVIDPGIGFGKTAAHNLAVLGRLPQFTALGRPVLLGVSRKSFLGSILDSPQMEDREWPTVALTSYGYEKGARIFRVHAVQSNARALRMTAAMLEAE